MFYSLHFLPPGSNRCLMRIIIETRDKNGVNHLLSNTGESTAEHRTTGFPPPNILTNINIHISSVRYKINAYNESSSMGRIGEGQTL